jgi:glycosyltransferase involved in cell wall biosynthesis
MRILVLSNLYPPHHAGTYDFRCQQVTEALRLRGHAVFVLTSHHGLRTEQRDAETDRRLILNGVFGHPALRSIRDLWRLERHNHGALREALQRFQPEVAHAWSLRGLSKSLLLTLRDLEIPTVLDVADDWLATGLREDPWLKWWNRPGLNLVRSTLEVAGQRNRLDTMAPTRCLPGCDRMPEFYGPPRESSEARLPMVAGFRFERLYFCSLALKQQAEAAGFQVAHAGVIYPGINTALFYQDVKPMNHPMRRMLTVTRLEEQCGVLTALRALDLARENGVKLSLTVCGRGDSDYVSRARSYAVQHQLPVEFVAVSDVTKDSAALYRQHDVFLYAAEWPEPFAVTPLEAMASGLPVIGACAGGVQELLRHGENALTYTPGNVVELASRFQELLMQPALRQQMAQTAQAEVMGKLGESMTLDRIEAYLSGSLEG